MKNKKIKISIIMAAKKSMPFIMTSIESFLKQDYKNKELIIVYDKSEDNTELYLKNVKYKNIKIFYHNKGLYSSLNYGIKKSTGEIIGTLHSDDAFNSKKILSEIATIFITRKIDLCYGNINFSKINNLNFIKREWKDIFLKKKYILPPHTGTFFKKKIIKSFYSNKYKISGDTELLLKLFNLKKINKFYYNNTVITMREGGLSTDYKYFIVKLVEDIKIFKKFNLNIFDVFKKVVLKITQINLVIKKKNNLFLKQVENKSKINFVNPNEVLNKEAFILCAFNLAYIAFNYKYNLRNHLSVFWPDGIFSYYLSKKKLPGRDFFKKFLLTYKSKKKIPLLILGNLPKISKSWIRSKVKQKIEHRNLPYGSVKKIYLEVDNIKLKKNQIIIITLPTPKQEIIANYIASKKKKCKIICLGGSLNMLSGYEEPAPNFFNKIYLEWLWRLKFDTRRRFVRLNISFYFFLRSYFSNKIKYLY